MKLMASSAGFAWTRTEDMRDYSSMRGKTEGWDRKASCRSDRQSVVAMLCSGIKSRIRDYCTKVVTTSET